LTQVPLARFAPQEHDNPPGAGVEIDVPACLQSPKRALHGSLGNPDEPGKLLIARRHAGTVASEPKQRENHVSIGGGKPPIIDDEIRACRKRNGVARFVQHGYNPRC
jgi:hypothetical protein